MDVTSYLSSLLRHLPTLVLVGLFVLMATGAWHGGCIDGDGGPQTSEHVVCCKCACHKHLQVPEPEIIPAEIDQRDTLSCEIDNDPLPDPEPTGIFRPPKHLA